MIIKKKVWSFISFICLVIMPCSYSEIKDVIQAIISFFGLIQLHILISWDKNLTNMFVVSISNNSVTFISWKSSEKELQQNTSFKISEMLLRLKFLWVQRFISLFLIALRTRFHHRFLVLLFYLRFDQIGNKLQQPFRNQRHKFTRYTQCQHYVQHFWSCP